MKKLYTLPIVAALLLLCLNLQAQDTYAGARTVILPPQILTQSSTTPLNTTNAWIDMHGYQGVGQFLFFATNTAGTTPKLYAYLEGSNDTTNVWALTNVSVATITSQSYTNFTLKDSTGTNAYYTTDTMFVPGSLVTATQSVSGFAGTYVSPAAFTSRATLCTNVAGCSAQLGMTVPQQPRYWRLVTTVTGDGAVFTTSGAIIARKQAPSW